MYIIANHGLDCRFVTPPRKFSPPSRPAPAVPTSVFLSRTLARPPRPSTAGSSSAPLLSSRMSRSTRRPSPCAATPVVLAALLKVRLRDNHDARRALGFETAFYGRNQWDTRICIYRNGEILTHNRQAVRCHPCPLAHQVRRVPSRSPQER